MLSSKCNETVKSKTATDYNILIIYSQKYPKKEISYSKILVHCFLPNFANLFTILTSLSII